MGSVVAAGLATVLALSMSGCTGVVARVNGRDITRKEFHDELEKASGLQVLNALILRQLLLERAQAEGCMPSKQDIDAEFARVKKEQFKDDETQMRQAMKAQGVDDKQLLDKFKLQLAVRNLRYKGVDASDEKLKAFFAEHEKSFGKPDRFTFRQIVLDSKDEAAKIIKELNSSEDLFQQVAQQSSMDPNTKENGGLVENAPSETLKAQAEPVFNALSKLQKNQITQDPVSIQKVFVVLKLLSHDAAETVKFEDVKDKVKDAYLEANGKREEQLEAEVAKKAQVVVLDPRFKTAIEQEFSGNGPQVPPGVENQIQKGPDMAAPTHVDETGEVPPASPGAAPGKAPAAPPPTAPATAPPTKKGQ
jgi:parvulin-like peptidyl-prolyl isomerase